VAGRLGLIISGAVGSAIDRLRLGYVIDFIDVHRLGFSSRCST
jgi:lipoprotein signal peptidase